MKIEFYNCPQPGEFSAGLFEQTPNFVSYQPNFEVMEKTVQGFRHYKNFLVIGHGGSITSFYALYEAFPHLRDRHVLFLNTVDPDYIYRLKQSLHPKDSLVIAISKSGTNTTMLEAMSQFLNFPMLIITEQNSPLHKIAEKLKAKFVEHPPIGGRYDGMTEVALLPALLAGLDVKALFKGAQAFYKDFHKNNLAFQAASVFWQLEQDGYVEVFLPIYSRNLFGFSSLIVQLCHESFGKNGVGQTYVAAEGPESQHHTNQRFFGGRKNIAGFFLDTHSFHQDAAVEFPAALHSVEVRGRALFDLNKTTLSDAMRAELTGTLEDARINGIPCAHLTVASTDYEQVGALMAFWQLYGVYASSLRGVDPFNQPQVENSKNISLDTRLKLKGLL